MRSIVRRITTLLAAIAVIFVGTVAPAQASGPAFDLQISGGTFSGAGISGYGPTDQLYMTIIAGAGSLTWTDNGSGAQMATPGMGNYTAPVIRLLGTQDQLNAALADFRFNNPCSAQDVTVYGQVSTENFIENPTTGYIFMPPTGNPDTFDNFMSQDFPLNGDRNTMGYLPSVTTKMENDIVQFFNPGNLWLGGSDAAQEGLWQWVIGPNAGIQFYQGQGNDGTGHPLGGAYTNWGRTYPANYAGDSNALVQQQNGKWADFEGSQTFDAVLEFGGTTGSDVSPVTNNIVMVDATYSSSGAFSGGDGTQGNPYQVSSAQEFASINDCYGPGVNFLQTSDISLPSDFPGIASYDLPFLGQYAGDGYTINIDQGLSGSNSGLFNVIGDGISPASDTVVGGFTLNGNLQLGWGQFNGMVAGQINHATVTNITLNGSITGASSGYLGGVVGYTTSSVISHIRSNLTWNVMAGGSDYYGGLVGYASGTSIANSGNYSSDMSIDGYARYVGGIVGYTDNATDEFLASETTMNVAPNNIALWVGGIAGQAMYQVIRKSYSNSTINSPAGGYMGGILGSADQQVTLSQDYAAGQINGNGTNGGLVGSVDSSYIADSYSEVGLDGSAEAGALVGTIANSSTIANSYAVGLISNDGTSEGWCGNNCDNSPGLYSGVFWVPSLVDVNASSVPTFDGVSTITEDQAKNFDTYDAASWYIDMAGDGSHTWTLCPGTHSDRPYLSALDQTALCTLAINNSQAPTVSGSGKIGEQITANPGTWDAGVGFYYQWKANGTNIAGAISSAYIPVAGDAGKTITVSITGTKPNYPSLTVESSNSVVVETPVVVPPAAGSGGVNDPVDLASDGTFVTNGDTAFSWNRAKGQLALKIHLVFVGPSKGTLTFKSGGKNYTCVIKFGMLKKIKATTIWLKSPYFCSTKADKKALAALKSIAPNTKVKITIWRELHNYKTYKKIKVVTNSKYVRLH